MCFSALRLLGAEPPEDRDQSRSAHHVSPALPMMPSINREAVQDGGAGRRVEEAGIYRTALLASLLFAEHARHISDLRDLTAAVLFAWSFPPSKGPMATSFLSFKS